MIYSKGWDCFSPEAGAWQAMACRVCGADMHVDRDVEGPTSWAEAMARRGHTHDSFTCRDADEPWHKQALKILQEAERTPSATTEESLQREAMEIIRTKKATKVTFNFR